MTNSKKIITISREFASGGTYIAKRVAQLLEVPYYDKELISMVAKESGFSLEFVEETGEYSATSSLLFNLSTLGNLYGSPGYTPENIPTVDKVHQIQSKIINEIASKGSCVIVGRSSNFILRARDDVLNVFIFGEETMKIERAMRIDSSLSTGKKALKQIKKQDRLRANHYRYYTGRPWGDARHYSLCLNSSELGFEKCCEIIIKAAK